MRVKFYLLVFVALVSCKNLLQAQNNTIESTDTLELTAHQVFALYERTDDEVILRWVPSDPDLWLKVNRGGYVIKRLNYIPDQEIDESAFEEIAIVKVKHKSDWYEEMKAMDTVPPYLAGCYECIYGDYKSLAAGQGFSAWMDQAGELKNKFSFNMFMADLDTQAAEYSGLRYVDDTAQKGQEYIYKIEPYFDEEIEMVYSPGIAIVTKEPTVYNPPLLRVHQRDGYLKLLWSRNNNLSNYSAFHIERSVENEPFERITKVPFIHGIQGDSSIYNPDNIYLDSLENYKPVQYRIVGLTPFGHEGPYSNAVSTMAIDLTPPPSPSEIDYYYLGGSNMLLKWQQAPCEDLDGYFVFRGHQVDDVFYRLNDVIIPKDSLQYIDTSAYELAENYYYILGIDTAGNAAQSLIEHAIMIDTIPPSAPTGLVGSIDSSGLMTLSWDHNPEMDVRGYKVFFANADYHEYSLITGQAIKDTVFQDSLSLNTLTEEIYYKVMAVDKRYNYSYQSEPIKLMRPDTIRPTSPIFDDYKVDKGLIYLHWANSSSKDVIRHELYRQDLKLGIWEVIKSFENGEDSYSDKELNAGQEYAYKIVAIDDAQLVSVVANELYLTAPRNILTGGLEAFEVNPDENRKALLSWELSTEQDYVILIYKDNGKAGFEFFTKLRNKESTYTDPYVEPGKNYSYTVKIKYEDGSSSAFSDVVDFAVK